MTSSHPVGWPSVHKTRLDNGIRVLTETMPGVMSATLGIWVENGSRYETEAQAGISHYLEHLFFKGTERRTAAQIAEEFDSVGGFFNAFTGKENTCYYAKVLGEHVPLAQDILGDIFLSSIFDPEEIERERSVVVQEILQGDDTPDDHVHDLFNLQYWPNHPLGFPVIGRVETVESFQRQEFVDFIGERYRPDRLVIAAAGRVDHEQMVAWVKREFSGLSGKTDPLHWTLPVPGRGIQYVEKPLEQLHICMGIPGISQASSQRYVAYVLNSALGGGMSSRLFQEVREKRGRAYSVYSFLSSYIDAGYLGVYVGTSAEWTEEVIGIVLNELRSVSREGLRHEELARVKNQLKGNLLLGLETSDSRMHRIARNEIYYGDEITPEEAAQRIDAVHNDEIVALAGELLRPNVIAATLLGNLEDRQLDSDLLAL
ncbi:MAG TPA: pitrilysin family protein [Terriglobales bacterium]|nr:pitrilysin family protein [Terriglobales bacterium]